MRAKEDPDHPVIWWHSDASNQNKV